MSKRPDHVAVQEQLVVAERKLRELQVQRAGALLDLADSPGDETRHEAIASYDLHIKRASDRITNLTASLTEAGRREAEAYAARMRKEGETLAAQALHIASGPRVEAGADVDAKIAALVESIERYFALGRETAELLQTGLRPLMGGTLRNAGSAWRRSHVVDLAKSDHGTLTELLQLLQSRDVRGLNLKHFAERAASSLHHAVGKVTEALDEAA